MIPLTLSCALAMLSFYNDSLICRYAELPKDVKNSISHRYRALAAMSEHFSQTNGTPPQIKKKKEED